MVKKIHIKAVAKHNIKVDAYWYRCGEKMDCYLTQNELEVFADALDNLQIIEDPVKKSNPVTIKSKEEKVEEVEGNGLQVNKTNAGHNTKKSPKKVS